MADHPTGDTRTRLRGRHYALIWLVVTTAGLGAVGARATYGAQVTADEPQYLMTALSLAEDLDLDISDEIRDERFLPFHEVGLNTQTLDLNASGQRLSPHDPLLPAVLAPAMAAGGWVGAKTLLAVLAGGTAAAVAWVAHRRLRLGAWTSSVTTVGLFATPPLTAYATQVYPELPAALLMTAALGVLLRPTGSDDAGRSLPFGSAALAVAAVIGLPWLSVKYVPVAGVLALALLAPMVSGPRRDGPGPAIAVASILGAAGIAYVYLHQRIYGGWTVYAAGDHFVDGESLVVGADPNYAGRTRRLVGLLIDRRFGLIPWAPAFLLLVPAVSSAARRAFRPGSPDPGVRLLLAVLGIGWAVATWVALTMHGWWWPGRQLVVVLPAAVLLIARMVDRRPRLLAGLGAVSVTSALNWWWLVAEASTGHRTLVVDFFETAAPLYRLWAPIFPDHMRAGPTDWVLTAAWSALFAAMAIAAWRRIPGTQPAADNPNADDRPDDERGIVAEGSPSTA